MNGKKLRLGLIGKDVSKSPSARLHTFILNEFGIECEFENVSVGKDAFDMAMRRLLGDFDAFCVTIPYKRDVMEYLDELKGDAFLFGAVNTVDVKMRTGYNTDGEGFLLMAKSAGISFAGKRVLVLGAGGSGRSTAVAVKGEGADVFIYQRDQEKLKETCAQLQLSPATDVEEGGYDILINCTGVGMHDTEGVSPVTEKAFRGVETAIDLIYTPAQSEFLRLAKATGAKTLNGASMLFYVVYYADCLIVNRQPILSEAHELYKKYCQTWAE